MLDSKNIEVVAESIISNNPEPVVRYRLLRDIFELLPGDRDLTLAKHNLSNNRWVQELEQEQWPDGSWGRLHSKDYKAKQRIPTTEFGVHRALALGLQPTHPLLTRTSK